MDTSTCEISAEPDGEHNSSLLSNCENFSYNEISVSSEKNIQSASCSSNMEVDEAPFSHRTGDFLPPFNSSISSGDICLNDVEVEETVSVRDIDSLTEKPVRDNSEFDLPPPLTLSNSSGDICLNDGGVVKTVSVRDIDSLTEKPVSDNSELAKIIKNRGTNPFSEFSDFVPLEHVESVLKVDTEVKTEIEDVAECEIPPEPCVSKLELLSEDEINFDGISRKSCAESSSSKDGSPSEPSCSGTSRTGLHSLSSDSEDDLPSINIPLPFKKRKREKPVEIISSSSCSEDEKSDIDYANLTPEQIKALIEQAKRYGRVKRCKCPKKKWSELPIKGPTQGSGKCTIGKGDWSENVSEPCQECAGGTCNDNRHKRGRHGRRRVQHTRSILSKSRARGTIGLDVPIIELSDSEEVTPASTTVVSEVTISAVPSGECIVLSSSEDDDDIVCEGVIQAEVKAQATEPEVTAKHIRPDVVVLNTSAAPVHSSFPYFSQSTSVFPSLSTAPLCPPVPLPTHAVSLGQDSETWPDLSVDLENWDVTMNLLANICGPPSTDGLLGNDSRVIPTPPERPPTPEGWSCPICLESKTAVNEIMSTTCGHVFCGNCIRSAVRIHKKCPTCRKKLTMKQFHKIFL